MRTQIRCVLFYSGYLISSMWYVCTYSSVLLHTQCVTSDVLMILKMILIEVFVDLLRYVNIKMLLYYTST